MYCRHCGKSMDHQAVVCVHCGVAAGSGRGYCGNCGQGVTPDQLVCIHCGAAVQQGQRGAYYNTSAYQPRKSRIAAGVLGVVLGCLGVHNFYLGHTGRGLAQLLITVLTCGWAAIPTAIWGLVEGILILTGQVNTDANGVELDN